MWRLGPWPVYAGTTNLFQHSTKWAVMGCSFYSIGWQKSRNVKRNSRLYINCQRFIIEGSLVTSMGKRIWAHTLAMEQHMNARQHQDNYHSTCYKTETRQHKQDSNMFDHRNDASRFHGQWVTSLHEHCSASAVFCLSFLFRTDIHEALHVMFFFPFLHRHCSASAHLVYAILVYLSIMSKWHTYVVPLETQGFFETIFLGGA